MKKTVSIILSTAPNIKSARKMADLLLKKKLAACISLIPKIESHYVWLGKKEKASEVLLLIKTAKQRYKALEKVLKSIHPYDCPEILQIAVNKSFKPYMDWLFAQFQNSR